MTVLKRESLCGFLGRLRMLGPRSERILLPATVRSDMVRHSPVGPFGVPDGGDKLIRTSRYSPSVIEGFLPLAVAAPKSLAGGTAQI
jgi:hypothetical protein